MNTAIEKQDILSTGADVHKSAREVYISTLEKVYVSTQDEKDTFRDLLMESRKGSLPRFLQRMKFIQDFQRDILQKQNDCTIDETLNFIFERIEDKLLNNETLLINHFLITFTELEKYRDEVLLGILTITYLWRKVLSFREPFFQRVDVYFRKNYPLEEAEALLAGLEYDE